jgi:hypothetical protein
MILSLAGYHQKNVYMIKHWEEYCAGRFPKDPPQAAEKDSYASLRSIFSLQLAYSL